MSFFDRLVNVGKGYASLLQKDDPPDDVLERELASRRPPPRAAEPEPATAPAPASETEPVDDLGLPRERKRTL